MAQASFSAVARISTVNTVDDVLGSLNNKYFYLYTALHTTVYTVWFNVASGGTAPKVPNTINVEIAIAAGATADVIATQLRSDIGSLSEFATSGATNQVIITNAATGTSNEPHEDSPNQDTGVLAPKAPGFTYGTTANGEIAVTNPTFIRVVGKVPLFRDYWNNNAYESIPFNYADIDIIVNERMIIEVWDG